MTGRIKIIRKTTSVVDGRRQQEEKEFFSCWCDVKSLGTNEKYNALQIAAAFGVNPDHLNDYSKSSYNNSAMQNLQFYVNTLLYNVTLYEQEMNRKLLTTAEQKQGLGFKFNVWVILRGDPSQQANIMQQLVTTAIYSPNEARDKLDMPPCDNGDIHTVNGSYVPLEDIGKAYEKTGGVSDAENQESSG